MRMWGVDPKLMCRKHLLGEHVEMHMFMGTLVKGSSLAGYMGKGLVEVENIISRHNKLAQELTYRGYFHNSPIDNALTALLYAGGTVDRDASLVELARRCEDCKARIEGKLPPL